MTEHVIITDDGPIRLVRLNRPAKKNALTGEMFDALTAALEGAAAGDIRCIVLAGGPGAFCAGADLQDFRDAAQHDGLRPQAKRFLRSLAEAGKPLVAAVQGIAVGIGTTMLLHCDFVVLAENAQLSTPFVNLALVPEAASSLLLPLRIGYARAYEMFALGEPVDAKTALTLGIANRVVPLDKLHAEAAHVAARLAKLPTGSLATTKKLMRNAGVLLAQIGAESERFAERLQTAEAREAFAAFAEKRAPDFAKVAG